MTVKYSLYQAMVFETQVSSNALICDQEILANKTEQRYLDDKKL